MGRELENGMVSGAYTCGIDFYDFGSNEYPDPDYDEEDEELEDDEDGELI